MYEHELKKFIQSILEDTIFQSELRECLVQTIDCTKIYESEEPLTVDAFFALTHYAAGEEDISVKEWQYFSNCFDGRCQYGIDQKMKCIM